MLDGKFLVIARKDASSHNEVEKTTQLMKKLISLITLMSLRVQNLKISLTIHCIYSCRLLNEYNFLQINSQKLIYASFKVKCESFITLKEVF